MSEQPLDSVSGLSQPHHADTEVIDLGGAAVVPGLIDAHTHLLDYGTEAVRSADLTGCRSIREVQDTLRRFRAENPGAPWLLGRRFDQELFEERRWITRADLDEVSSEVPIMVSRLCLHAVVVNSAALRIIGKNLGSEQMETGILVEDACSLAWNRIPPPAAEERIRAAEWALNEARRVGLTGVHCIVDSMQDLEALRELGRRGALPVRVTALCQFSMMDSLAGGSLRQGSGTGFLKIGPLKIYADGAMGPRTAAMKEPFADDPGNSGILFHNEQELAEMLRAAQSAGFQCAVHAIGDLAVECAVKAIQLAAAGRPGNPFRHRIEHASQLSEGLVEEMARAKVVACVQPQFVLTDFWTRERVGPERYRWSYPFNSMLAAGITLAMGSDCPVERLDPVELLDRAVSREPHSLAERLSVEETIRAYSYGSAFAAFDEARLGALEPGKLADFTVFETDPMVLSPEELGGLRVAGAAVGGELK